VVANLVGNAAKHTESRIELTADTVRGGSGAEVSRSSSVSSAAIASSGSSGSSGSSAASGDKVEIRVIDHGPGIPASDHERVFRPFQRLGDHDNTAGVGLGLALARGLVEAMGGELRPEETPGGGLTMVVAVPARTAPGPAEGTVR
jgi:two-component system sensor histidine kinase KdpD